MDSELAEAIELEYYRFDPFLRAAVHDIVSINNKQYIYDIDRGRRYFELHFYCIIFSLILIFLLSTFPLNLTSENFLLLSIIYRCLIL